MVDVFSSFGDFQVFEWTNQALDNNKREPAAFLRLTGQKHCTDHEIGNVGTKNNASSSWLSGPRFQRDMLQMYHATRFNFLVQKDYSPMWGRSRIMHGVIPAVRLKGQVSCCNLDFRACSLQYDLSGVLFSRVISFVTITLQLLN